ncbi:NRAMP family divalent metal transporter, partial [Undibacterium arcticum]
FWQASEEVEEIKADPEAEPVKKAPDQARQNLKRIKIDTFVGMGFSNLVAFFIMLTTAVALHSHGVTSIDTSAQAASALRPLAGKFAFALFAIGIIGTGLLALPVLAGSAAYAMAGAFKWRNSLELKPSLAKAFYSVIILATLGGIALSFTSLDPIRALFWSAVINGVISAPIMMVAMLLATNSTIMGQFVIGRTLKLFGWLATGLMVIPVLVMLYTLIW